MKISFAIPAYNEENYISGCLDAILTQASDAATRGGMEIIVVNNASSDGTAAVVKKYSEKYPAVKLVDESKKGITHARRAGFLASSGELIANVDADTRITPGWVRRVLDEFARDPKLVALSGPFIYYDLSPAIRFLTKVHYAIGYLIYHIFHIGAMLQGGNFVVRRDALLKIGGYDTNIAFYGEDTDIARRMSKIGKVKFTFKLPAYTSGRRLAKEGEIKTGIRYAINYIWITLFKRPYTKDYEDIRVKNGKNVVQENIPKDGT